jgi:histidinol-phosphatase (PHP family)
MKADGHIHTPYCPHGSTDPLEDYVKRALELQFTEITFTEHAPLPSSFIDPTPKQDSAMNANDVETYIADIEDLKKKYKSEIKINVGFEVDFIEGYEEETIHFLDKYGSAIDDSILSVHFLKIDNDYVCVDFSEDAFKTITSRFGSVENVYRAYFATVEKSLLANLGRYKPKRIGHMTLVQKFQKQFPVTEDFKDTISSLLSSIKRLNFQLDYNGAGVVKALCKEPYPPNWVVDEAVKRNIPLVYGSDAHSVNGLNQGFQQLIYKAALVSPTEG